MCTALSDRPVPLHFEERVRMETRQLPNSTRLAACLAVDLVVAWRLVDLTKLGHAMRVFGLEQVQWHVLLGVASSGPRVPEKPTILQQAVRVVTNLGS
jgi:hypothetical protein